MNVIAGGTDAFDGIMYPQMNQINRRYIERQLTNFNDSLNDVGRRFLEGAKHVYDAMTNSEIAQAARLALSNARNFLHPNQIRPLYTLEDMQSSFPVMQRWIMASPEIQNLNREQRCYGFSDTYYDNSPNDVSDNRYDYRRVMNGILQEDPNDGSLFYIEYPDSLKKGDEELTFRNQIDILKTWDIISGFIKEGEDPTNPYGNRL